MQLPLGLVFFFFGLGVLAAVSGVVATVASLLAEWCRKAYWAIPLPRVALVGMAGIGCLLIVAGVLVAMDRKQRSAGKAPHSKPDPRA